MRPEKRQRLFELFYAYTDESGDNRTNLFTLGSVVIHGSTRWYFDYQWDDCLKKKNLSLATQGRQQLSRYHASDCSTFHNEFADWTQEEQRDFTKQLLRVFRRNPVHTFAFTLNLNDLISTFPEIRANPHGFAYILLLHYTLREIGERTMRLYPGDRIACFHDMCDFPGAIKEKFAQIKSDETFGFRKQFDSISQIGWKDDVLLQAADFAAYEAFKEVERRAAGRKRRKSLELILEMDSFSGVSKSVEKQQLEEIKKTMDGIDQKTKDILLSNGGGRIFARPRTTLVAESEADQ